MVYSETWIIAAIQKSKNKGSYLHPFFFYSVLFLLLPMIIYLLQSNHWVGTVLLNTCQVIERPSKKDGFCFKLFHPLEQSIWAPRGPEKETIGIYFYHYIHCTYTAFM